MMRSLFAGVSGLRNHQISMDVIGNNIANINTIGFKGGRVTFEESLTQMIRDASRPHGSVGGINPQQVGLGISIGSIDTLFTQGNLEMTGNVTDLAIQGDAFFVISDGYADYYTRAGNFVVDGEGRLVAPKNGFVVQGMMAESGEIASGTTITDVTLPFGQKAPAKATTEIDYTCNLDANTRGLAQIWAADFHKAAEVIASAAPTSLTIDGDNDTLIIEVDNDMGGTVTRTLTLTSVTHDGISQLVSDINTQIDQYDDIAGEVVAEVVDVGGVDMVQIRTVDLGGTSTRLRVSGNASFNMNLAPTVITGSAAPNLDIVTGVNDTLTITAGNGTGDYVTATVTIPEVPGGYLSIADLGDAIDDEIDLTALDGLVTASGATGVIVLAPEGAGTHVMVEGNGCDDMNLSDSMETGTTANTSMNDLPAVTNALTDGDTFTISGINPNGTVVNATYTYDPLHTIQDFIGAVHAAFSGVTVSLSADGKIQLTDSIRGETNTMVTVTFSDEDDSGSAVTVPSFVSQQTGRDAGTHTASITTYDSKGATHTISVEFQNISTNALQNVWSWEAYIDNGDIIPSAGNKGTLRFNTDGSLAVFTIGDGQPLTFDPGGGANTMQINLDAGDAGTFSGITQLHAPTTTVAKHQDGYGMGNLQTISIDETGEITGHFSNGVSQVLAQVALAKFNNPGGLLRAGDNMYKSSANSGTPVKGTVGGGIEASIASGSLEMSNVDLAQEFTDMIVAQRGFQANARVISTADTLLDEIVRLKR